MVTTLDGYMAPSAAARRIGVAATTLRLWVKQGQVPALKTPNGIVLKTEDVERLVAERAKREAPLAS